MLKIYKYVSWVLIAIMPDEDLIKPFVYLHLTRKIHRSRELIRWKTDQFAGRYQFFLILDLHRN